MASLSSFSKNPSLYFNFNHVDALFLDRIRKSHRPVGSNFQALFYCTAFSSLCWLVFECTATANDVECNDVRLGHAIHRSSFRLSFSSDFLPVSIPNQGDLDLVGKFF